MLGQSNVQALTGRAAAMVLRELLAARVIARCLCVAASLGLADLLTDGPLTTRELAVAAGADAGSLYRVLRGLATRGIFAESDEGRFEMTPLAEPLRLGVPGSVRDLVMMFGTTWQWEAWADLEHAVRTGEGAFVHRHGTDLFGYLEAHPDEQKLFNAAMTSRPGMGGDVVVVNRGQDGAREEVSGGEILAVVMDLELVNFDHPSEVRTFEKGKFELYEVGPATLGRATYEPGWKWSEHVGTVTGETSCQVEHVGLVLSGQAVAKMDDGREVGDAGWRLLLRPARTRQLGGRR